MRSDRYRFPSQRSEMLLNLWPNKRLRFWQIHELRNELNIPHKLSDVIEENKINLDQLSKMALEDPSTSTNPKKLTIDDMKILYEHSISGKLF